MKLDPLGIDPKKTEKLLGDIDIEDKAPQVYVEEHVEYLPERRASQFLIEFGDDKATTVIRYLCLLPVLNL